RADTGDHQRHPPDHHTPVGRVEQAKRLMPNNFNLALTIAVLPEAILVVVAGCCALLAGLRPGERPDLYRWMACIAIAGAVAAAGLALFGMRLNKNGVALVVWGGGLTVDHFSFFFTVAVVDLVF